MWTVPNPAAAPICSRPFTPMQQSLAFLTARFPIQKLFDSVSNDTPASGLQARMVSIDIVDTIAAVRVELENWNGYRYTDFFTLLKTGGEWKILNKAFHQH
jgi:hypothetical protein